MLYTRVSILDFKANQFYNLINCTIKSKKSLCYSNYLNETNI